MDNIDNGEDISSNIIGEHPLDSTVGRSTLTKTEGAIELILVTGLTIIVGVVVVAVDKPNGVLLLTGKSG